MNFGTLTSRNYQVFELIILNSELKTVLS